MVVILKLCILPKLSAHVMWHTACTRMAECRMDVKVLQYIMGYAHIDVTMEVYNHIGELTRIEKEIAWLDSMALNAWNKKTKIGVKIEKITILKEIRYCKPLILNGLQKITQKLALTILFLPCGFIGNNFYYIPMLSCLVAFYSPKSQ